MKTIAMIFFVCILNAIAGTYITLDFPGSNWTQVNGIYEDRVVGAYTDDSGWHGFVYDGTTWTTLDAPGSSSSTQILGIDGSNIVGGYSDMSGSHGCLFNGNSWVRFDVPSKVNTVIGSMDGNNIIGWYQDSVYTQRKGFVYNGTKLQTFIFEGSISTEARGVFGGNIVGFYTDNYGQHGFGGSFSNSAIINLNILEIPGHTIGAYGISGEGIVGAFNDDYGQHGFFLPNDSEMIQLDFPGVRNTGASDIYGNKIVGNYFDDYGQQHGFLYTIPEPSSVIILSFVSLLFLHRKR